MLKNSPESEESKKIVLLKSNLGNQGGLEKYTMRIARSFAEKGCPVTILTTSEEKHLQHRYSQLSSNVTITNLGKPAKLGLFKMRQFDKKCMDWLKAHPTEVVFGLDRNSFQTHYRAGNGVHAEYLEKRAKLESLYKRISFKINPMHRTILRLERLTFENPDLQVLFVNSQMVADEIKKHYQTAEHKIKVIHNGVEWEEMNADFLLWESKQVENCRQLGLDPCCFQFLFIGNGYRRKGLQYLLEALTNIKWENYQLSVIGKDRELGGFEALANQLGIGKKVKFFGPRSDIRRFYQLADALVIPSIYDPFANVTVEALAMGIFVVTSKFNGGSEIITPETGVVIEDLFNRDSVTAALVKALNHPKTTKRAQMIRDSVKHLDFKNQLTQMITSVLGNK